MKHEILLGLTTTPKSDWRDKIKEIDQFSIKELALFPTFLEINDRRVLYKLLEKTGIKKIPHVHLRDDMEQWEIELFTKKYGTSLFNIHVSNKFNKLLKSNNKYLDRIFVENDSDTGKVFVDSLKRVEGICFDISHYQDLWVIQKIPGCSQFPKLLKKYKIGCCHISAVREKPVPYNSWDIKTAGINWVYSCHLLDKLTEIDYVKDYIEYLPKYVSIELENSFKEQLGVKKRLDKIING